jgi:hypothetical protein
VKNKLSLRGNTFKKIEKNKIKAWGIEDGYINLIIEGN